MSSRDVSTVVESSEAEVVEVLEVVLGRDEFFVNSNRSANQDWATMVDHWRWGDYDRSCYIQYFSPMPLISPMGPIPAMSSIDDNRGHSFRCGMDRHVSMSRIVLDVDSWTVHHDLGRVQVNGG